MRGVAVGHALEQRAAGALEEFRIMAVPYHLKRIHVVELHLDLDLGGTTRRRIVRRFNHRDSTPLPG